MNQKETAVKHKQTYKREINDFDNLDATIACQLFPPISLSFHSLSVFLWFINLSFSCRSHSYSSKYENRHRIQHSWFSLGSKFQLQQTILIFWNNIPRQGYFQTKKGKNHHRILHIRMSLGIEYWTSNFEYWDQIYPKQVSLVKSMLMKFIDSLSF